MSNWEKIHEIMKSDPKRKWTAPDLAKLINPGMKEWEYPAFRCNILTCLKKAEKYGLVKQEGMTFINGHNTAAKVWVLA